MNNARRKAIEELITRAENLKVDVESICEEEQEYHDNMPESLQNGEKGDQSQSAIDALESVAGNLEDAASNLDEARQ